jgi:two-component system, NarL family, response regulator LiaR
MAERVCRMPIRVLIIDDHHVVRRGLNLVLSTDPELEVVGEAGDGAEAVQLARKLRPDVVLMDIAMPVLDGIAATEAIARDMPGIRVLALTSATGDHAAIDAIRAGAAGYLLKDATPEEVCRAVKSVAAGAPYLAAGVAAQLMREVAPQTHGAASDNPGNSAARQPLTAREVSVLRLLGQGKSNLEIARALAIGESTVKTHVHHLLTKLGVQNRTQAALHASEHGSMDRDRADDAR